MRHLKRFAKTAANYLSLKRNHQPLFFNFFYLFGHHGITNSNLDLKLTTYSFSSIHQSKCVMKNTLGFQRLKLYLNRAKTSVTTKKPHFVPYLLEFWKKKFSWNWNSRKNPISFLQIGFFPWHQSGSWFMKIFRNIIFTEKFLYVDMK